MVNQRRRLPGHMSDMYRRCPATGPAMLRAGLMGSAAMFWTAARLPHLSLGPWRRSAGEVAEHRAAALWQEDKDIQKLSSWT